VTAGGSTASIYFSSVRALVHYIEFLDAARLTTVSVSGTPAEVRHAWDSGYVRKAGSQAQGVGSRRLQAHQCSHHVLCTPMTAQQMHGVKGSLLRCGRGLLSAT
jgi:hypothetical protein